MADTRPPVVVVVSDGRGDTCAQVVQAALVQFEDQPCRIEQHPNVRTGRDVERVVAKAAALRAVLFYTLVGDATRAAMARAARRRLVPAVDVLGPGFSALHDLFRRRPQARPGLLYASNRERFDRQQAIDFTLAHDDGRGLSTLGGADVVLAGVSRVSKSSTCFYLAYEGICAANVPLVPGLPPPRELLRLSRRKVVGLRMNVHRLRMVREARAEHIGLHETDAYLDEREIARELAQANRLMDARGWRSLDVSYLAVEEIAREVRLLISPSRRR